MARPRGGDSCEVTSRATVRGNVSWSAPAQQGGRAAGCSCEATLPPGHTKQEYRARWSPRAGGCRRSRRRGCRRRGGRAIPRKMAAAAADLGGAERSGGSDAMSRPVADAAPGGAQRTCRNPDGYAGFQVRFGGSAWTRPAPRRGARRTCRNPGGCTGFSKRSTRSARVLARRRARRCSAPVGTRTGIQDFKGHGLTYP